jgi:hypothetical protein
MAAHRQHRTASGLGEGMTLPDTSAVFVLTLLLVLLLVPHDRL